MEPIEEIKGKLDIVSFITPYVALKQTGRNFKGVCPFHSEKTPSFIVSPERQIWHCFGCNKGGDVITFYQEIENLEFYEALQTLAERTGVKLSFKAPEEVNAKQRLYAINALTAKFYHYLLTKHKTGAQALAYVTEQRNMLSETIEKFQLGFAPKGFEHLVKFLKKHNITEQEAYKAGVLGRSQRGVYDMFRGRLMFPLHDHRGNVIGFAGRVFGEQTDTAKYINTPETPVYIKGNTLYGLYQNSQAIKEKGNVLLVEGEFDVLSSIQAGVKHVVAIKGTALTEHQVYLLRRFAQTVLLALDQDSAGKAATKRSIAIAQEGGLQVRVVSLPFGKDVDEVAQASPRALKQAIANARPYYDWLMETVLAASNVKDPYSKKQAAEELLPTIGAIDNEIVREHYFKQLAKHLDASPDVLMRTARQLSRKRFQGSTAPKRMEPANEKTHEVILLEYILSLLLQAKKPGELLEVILPHMDVRLLEKSAHLQVLEHMKTYFTKYPSGTNDALLATLPNELKSTVDLLFVTDVEPALFTDDLLLTKEVEKKAQELHRLMLKKRLSYLREKISQAEDSKPVTLEKLNAEFALLSKQLKNPPS